MSKLKMRYYGDPCLRKKSVVVKKIGVSERLLIQEMIETMHEYKGVGLAAPQVGINQRIFVADIGLGPLVIVNPKVLKRAGSEYLEEGCLSIPGITVNIKRPQTIKVRYSDDNNQEVEREFSDLMARVFLHETDHLNGKLITDYASLRQRLTLKKKIKELLKEKSKA